MKTKDMLEQVIRRAVLKPQEKEDFMDLWDRIHLYNHVSDRQKAWVEGVYFGQKLDQDTSPTVRRRVIIPTWQQERRNRKERREQRAHLAEPKSGLSVRVLAPVESTVEREPPRLVAVKSTDIKRLQGRPTGRAPVSPRPAARSGTYEAVVPTKAHQIGFIHYEGAPRELLLTDMQGVRDFCPRIQPGSEQYRKIDAFFRAGGKVLKVKPTETRVAS